MSFGIHKSSFFTFHGPKKHNIFSNIFQAQNIGIEWEWPVTRDRGSSVRAHSSGPNNHKGFTGAYTECATKNAPLFSYSLSTKVHFFWDTLYVYKTKCCCIDLRKRGKIFPFFSFIISLRSLVKPLWWLNVGWCHLEMLKSQSISRHECYGRIHKNVSIFFTLFSNQTWK